jgi:ABC-type nitrate/sulfonate/bicarbonate transport system substrate-binding protein
MRRGTRLLATLGLTAMIGASLVACTPQASAEGPAAAVPTSEADINGVIDKSKVKKSIVVGVDNPYYLFHEDVLIAQKNGYFKEFGIDKVEIVTLEDPLPGLIGGSVDFALYDTDTAIAAAANTNSGIRYLSVYLGGEANILGVGPGIDTAADLKGKTITGGQFGSRNDFLIRKLLTDNGLDPDVDVKLVSTGGQSNERLQSVIAGTVDGASLQIRHEEILKKEGGKFLFFETGKVPQNGWSASKILKESPETAAAFLAATLKARAFIVDQANKKEVLDYMDTLDFELPDEYKAAYANENNAEYHVADGGFDPADMDKFIDEQISLDVVPANTDWKKYVDLVPLWRAQKALGIDIRPAVGF